ncbi:hypothetical protein TNCV_4906711 [Trichonephila clavipes]|uniref:Uncharacterized protein n=1 Tax=Trichonephila clavipes TaxID=2585209 RepID=A0A8X6RM80_TRICX|nr:hypothetical protein TNCV_4906711 [Trichonephila clavipes]
MATLFQPNQEVKREGKMQIRKLLNNRSLEPESGQFKSPASKLQLKSSGGSAINITVAEVANQELSSRWNHSQMLLDE